MISYIEQAFSFALKHFTLYNGEFFASEKLIIPL